MQIDVVKHKSLSSEDSDSETCHSEKMRIERSYRLPLQSKVSRRGWVVPKVIVPSLLSHPIDCLDLSPRPARILNGLRRTFIHQLFSYSTENLLKAPDLGLVSTMEVQTKLLEYISGQCHTRLGLARTRQEDMFSVGTKAFVCGMLSLLPERESKIVANRYGLWDGRIRTLNDLGNELSLSRERIRQIEERNLTRLRRAFGSTLVQEFLDAKVKSTGAKNFKRNNAGLKESESVAIFSDDCTYAEATLAVPFLRTIGSK